MPRFELLKYIVGTAYSIESTCSILHMVIVLYHLEDLISLRPQPPAPSRSEDRKNYALVLPDGCGALNRNLTGQTKYAERSALGCDNERGVLPEFGVRSKDESGGGRRQLRTVQG